jgi:hypothetical protein
MRLFTLGLLASWFAIAPSEAKVRVQCKGFEGKPAFELLFREAPGFSEETRADWETYLREPAQFVPGPVEAIQFQDLESLSGIRHMIQQYFPSPTVQAAILHIQNGFDLNIQLVAATGRLDVTLKKYYERIENEVVYGAREWEEDGGLLAGEVRVRTPQGGLSFDSSKVLCGVHIQGRPF